MESQVQVYHETGGALTAVQVKAQVQLIQEVMEAVMIKDTHYGTIPGTQKPTLYKAGAEKLLSTFRIAVEPLVEDLSTVDEARFRVLTRATSMVTGAFLGSGLGEASSDEEKYKWRGSVHINEWEATPPDRKRLKYTRDGSEIMQIRVNVADVRNTVLKVAKKRSQIDMALTVTGASDIFAQDLEDLPDGMAGEEGEKKAPAKKAAVDADTLDPKKGRAMKASFDGTCVKCRAKILKGANQVYFSDVKKVMCDSCVALAAEPAK